MGKRPQLTAKLKGQCAQQNTRN